MASEGNAYCTALLCSRDGEGPNACHDIQHHLTGPEAVYQPLVLSLQARVPVNLLHTNHFHASLRCQGLLLAKACPLATAAKDLWECIAGA